MISNSIESHDADNIINSINNLIHINDKDKYRYLNALLNPEKIKDVKIPSKIPIPSCTFQLHSSIRIPGNNNFRFMFNPFFLYDESYCYENVNTIERFDKFYGPYGEYEFYADIKSSDKGIGYYFPLSYTTMVNIYKQDWSDDKNIYTKGMNINQGVPHLYKQYRLVSASMTVKYVGPIDQANGIIGGAIITEDDNHITSNCEMKVGRNAYNTGGSQNEMYYKYYDYNTVINSVYHQQNKCIDGLRLLYFPLDNSYEEFVDVFTPNNVKTTGFVQIYGNKTKCFLEADKNFKNGFNFYIYFLNNYPRFDGADRYKVDIYCNFECLPLTEFMNIIPINLNINYISDNEKKQMIKYIQGKPITKLNENINLLNWKQLLKKLKNSEELNEDNKYDFDKKLLQDKEEIENKKEKENIEKEEMKDDEEKENAKEEMKDIEENEDIKEEEMKDDEENENIKGEEIKNNEENK